MLLIVAGLLVRARQHALYTDPGFGYRATADHRSATRHSTAIRRRRRRPISTRCRAGCGLLPGVKSVSLVQAAADWGTRFHAMDEDINGHQVPIYPNWVDAGVLSNHGHSDAAGADFLSGREECGDRERSRWRGEQWPGQNPIGQQLPNGDAKDIVVGVAGDAHVNALNDDDAVEQYWPAQQEDMPEMVVMVRTAGEPDSLPPMIKAISESLDAKLFPEISQMKLLYHDNVLESD